MPASVLDVSPPSPFLARFFAAAFSRAFAASRSRPAFCAAAFFAARSSASLRLAAAASGTEDEQRQGWGAVDVR